MSEPAVRPLILFAPGAGAPSSSAWMRAWARRLETVGDVVPFDYPYMRAGKRAPDRLPVLIQAHREALEQAGAGPRPVVLAGKSMGGRVGCHLAVALAQEGRGPAALVCFGYPLKAASTGVLRDQVLRDLRTPVLFLQGDRDALCPLPLLAEVRPAMTAPHAVHVVGGGDHSLLVGAKDRARAGRTQAQIDDDVLAAVRAFIATYAGGAAHGG